LASRSIDTASTTQHHTPTSLRATARKDHKDPISGFSKRPTKAVKAALKAMRRLMALSSLLGIRALEPSGSSSAAAAASSAPYLLRIKVSQRGAESWSLRLQDEFTLHFSSKYPSASIVDRETQSIPHLDLDNLSAGRVHPSKHTAEQAAAFSLANTLTDELVGASHILISSPMYNWGPPSSLKAWMDRVINSRTFYGNPKLLSGIPITFIIASGGGYSIESGADAARLSMDHFRPLLIECFTQMGAEKSNIRFVNVDPTGPIDFGAISASDSNSGVTRAKASLPAAAQRIKPGSCKDE